MLTAYASAGFDPAHFWGLTPRLYVLHMNGARDRLEMEQRNRAWLAWHVEALHRQKKLPDLQKFAGGRAARPEPQSAEVLTAMGMALARCWGAKEKV